MISLRSTLTALHQLAKRHSVYLLVLWTMLAGALLAARTVYTGTQQYGFLVWNLFLAWIPYLASLWAGAGPNRGPRQWRRLLLPGVVWLLFLPNAPYIVTDLIHLGHHRSAMPIWYDAVLVSTFAFTGCLLGVVSLRIMHGCVRSCTGSVTAWVFAMAAIGLCGPGVYMGRVLRWNSWDVLTRPTGMLKTVLGAVADPLGHWPAVAASLTFAGFMLGCYVTFVALRAERVEETSDSRERPEHPIRA
jgi:uncharacterized membrane protein